MRAKEMFNRHQGSYGFLITKELIFGCQILDLKDHFSASLNLFKENLLKRPTFSRSNSDSLRTSSKYRAIMMLMETPD